jgi:hypothetical protein
VKTLAFARLAVSDRVTYSHSQGVWRSRQARPRTRGPQTRTAQSAGLIGHVIDQFRDGTAINSSHLQAYALHRATSRPSFEGHLYSVEHSDLYRLTTIGFTPEGTHDEFEESWTT